MLLEVGISEGRGRGVFATIGIAAGTVLHVDHSRLLEPRDIELLDQTSIGGHWFDHPTMHGHGLLPMGLSGMVNHSIDPNAILDWIETPLGFIGKLVASRSIAAGEEILIYYGIGMPDDWV